LAQFLLPQPFSFKQLFEQSEKCCDLQAVTMWSWPNLSYFLQVTQPEVVWVTVQSVGCVFEQSGKAGCD
jgi:hypothetical protein